MVRANRPAADPTSQEHHPDHRRRRLGVWPARVGELELGRRRDDDFAAAYRVLAQRKLTHA